MTWKGETMEDIRYKFVISVQNDLITFTELCKAYGVSRKTGYKWLNRYYEGGREALNDLLRAPLSRPRDLTEEVKNSILEVALLRSKWGAKKLRRLLMNDHPEVKWPSITTFGNLLKREGFSKRRRIRHKMAKVAPVQGVSECNETWCADFKGWWRTKDGKKCEPFTVSDAHSRFLLSCEPTKKKDFDSIWKILVEVFQEYGMPDRFRTDNGSPFATNSVGRLSRMAIKLIRLGITPEWIAPGKPQQNGRHERIHRTLKLEAATPPSETLVEQVENLIRFRYDYNFKRPHEALDLYTPSDIYVPSNKVWTGEDFDPSYTPEYETYNLLVFNSLIMIL